MDEQELRQLLPHAAVRFGAGQDPAQLAATLEQVLSMAARLLRTLWRDPGLPGISTATAAASWGVQRASRAFWSTSSALDYIHGAECLSWGVQAVEAAASQPPGAEADARLASVLQLAGRQGQDVWALHMRFVTAQLVARDIPPGQDVTAAASRLGQQAARARVALQVRPGKLQGGFRGGVCWAWMDTAICAGCARHLMHPGTTPHRALRETLECSSCTGPDVVQLLQ